MNNKKRIFRNFFLTSLVIFGSSFFSKDSKAMQNGNRNKSRNTYCNEENKKAKLFTDKRLEYGNHSFIYSGYAEDNKYFYLNYYSRDSEIKIKCNMYLYKTNFRKSFFEILLPKGEYFKYFYKDNVCMYSKNRFFYKSTQENMSEFLESEFLEKGNKLCESLDIIKAFKEAIDEFGMKLYYEIRDEKREKNMDPYGLIAEQNSISNIRKIPKPNYHKKEKIHKNINSRVQLVKSKKNL